MSGDNGLETFLGLSTLVKSALQQKHENENQNANDQAANSNQIPEAGSAKWSNVLLVG